MTTYNIEQAQFQKHDIPTRLKHLAAHLNKIKLVSTETTQPDEAKSLIRESQYFIEWTAPEMEIDIAVELVDLARALSRWKLNWESIWCDSAALTQVAIEAESWSQRVSQMSENFNQPALSE
jgi:hypothetical protein